MSDSTALALTVVFAAVLGFLHLLGGRLPVVPRLDAAARASFAGGLVAGYVFLHTLPELARGNAEVGEQLDDRLADTALADVAIFVIALVGFVVFYALQWAAQRAIDAGREPPAAVFNGHVVAFAAYNAVVVYTLPLKLRTSLSLALVFCAIISLHLLQTDRVLSDQFPSRFARRHGRALLAAGAGIGALAALAGLESTLLLTTLTALLAGAILLNALQHELPGAAQARLGWFTAALVLATAVLLSIAAAGQRGAA